MQEIMNKIADTEQQAISVRNAALNEAKTAQAEAARQGKELLDNARKEAAEASRTTLDEANAKAQALLSAAAAEARLKAARLRSESEENVVSAARFITERIVDSV